MGEPDPDAGIASARQNIEALAAEFAEAARRTVDTSLNRAVQKLVVRQAGWFNQLDERTGAALRNAVAEAIRRSADRVAGRLREADLWLSPSVVLNGDPQPELDDPANRVWIALLNAADPLDPLLLEFGLQPSDVPDRGGGHYGLQPQSVGELDPAGTLAGLWARYRKLYEVYAKALRVPEEKKQQRDEDEARRRWSEPT